MEIKDLTAILVVAMVGCVLVAGFVPVVGESVSATTTFENEGYYRMSAYDNAESGDYTITWAIEKPTVLVINDVEYDMDSILTVKNTYYTVFASDGAYMRCAINGTNRMVVQCHNYLGNPMLAFDTASTTMVSMSLTIDADSIDVTRVSDSTVTTSTNYSEWIYVFDPNGYYIMKDKDKSAYVKDEDIIILAGVTRVNTSPATEVGVYGHGTIDSLVIESGYPDDDTVYSNIVINSDVVAGYIELNTVGTITFDMTRSDVTTGATYSYYLVPYQVTAEKAIHADANTASIVSMIPFILIMGIVLMFVGVVLVRRYV